MDSIKGLLSEEIIRGFNDLKDLDSNSDEYKSRLKDVEILMKQALQADEHEYSYDMKLEELKSEKERKDAELALEQKRMEEDRKSEKRRHLFDIGVKALGAATMLSFNVWLAVNTFKFEETQTFSSNIGRNFISSIFKKKM